MNRVEKLTIFIGLVSCVAALAVVPEIRCSIGLSAPELCPLPATGAAARADGVIERIRSDFNQIEQLASEHAAWRADVPVAGADSAYATYYPVGGEVRKIRVRSFREGGYRRSRLFYYTGGELIFLHEVEAVAERGDWRQTGEARFYYADGKPVGGLAGSGARGLVRGDAGATERARMGRALIRSVPR